MKAQLQNVPARFQNANVELVGDNDWQSFLSNLVGVLEQFNTKIEVVDFMGQIKQKIEDCSRSYTGMWSLDMMHECYKQNQDKLPEFKQSLDALQNQWNEIMGNIREERKELLGYKCVEFFYKHYSGAEHVVSMKDLNKMKEGWHQKWLHVSRTAQQQNLHQDKEYQGFLAHLMIEMTKY